MEWLIGILATTGAAIAASMKYHKWGWWLDTPQEPIIAPPQPVTPPQPVVDSKPIPYLWNTPENARHSVRMICDEEGLSVPEKNILCAVIMGESEFYNYLPNGRPTTHVNHSAKTGLVTSTDWGICQINDRYHIGSKLDFPSIEYVMENPEKVVRWMIARYKEGHLNWWVAYSSGSYTKYL